MVKIKVTHRKGLDSIFGEGFQINASTEHLFLKSVCFGGRCRL